MVQSLRIGRYSIQYGDNTPWLDACTVGQTLSEHSKAIVRPTISPDASQEYITDAARRAVLGHSVGRLPIAYVFAISPDPVKIRHWNGKSDVERKSLESGHDRGVEHKWYLDVTA